MKGAIFAIIRAASIFFTCGLPIAGTGYSRKMRRDGILSIIEGQIKTSAPALRKKDCEIFHELGQRNARHKQS
jgi:hypothetical protein